MLRTAYKPTTVTFGGSVENSNPHPFFENSTHTEHNKIDSTGWLGVQ